MTLASINFHELQNKAAMLIELCLFFGSLGGSLIILVQQQQPVPYMDEIFHIPMVQKYCKGDYRHWDDKITTPPGLYVFSSLILQMTSKVFSLDIDIACSTFYIRLTNMIFLVLNFFVLYGIISSYCPSIIGESQSSSQTRVYRIFKAVTLNLFPVLFFYVTLYYTDQGSVFFVLTAYFFHVNEHYLIASIFGAVSITFRQTNIVWIIFLLGLAFEKDLVVNYGSHLKRFGIYKKTDNEIDEQMIYNSNTFDALSLSSSVSFILCHPLIVMTILAKICIRCVGYIATIFSFSYFVYWNGGIVLGDKTAHVATLHIPQVFYFFAFVAVFNFCHFLHPKSIKRFFSAVLTCQGLVFVSFCLSFMFLAVHWFTFEHPYLLADNRHYMFYVWMRVYRHTWVMKYVLVPGYFYCLVCFYQSLSSRSVVFRLMLLVCISAALIPAALIEPRYYIIPYLIWRLESRYCAKWPYLLVELSCFVIINIATFYKFLYHPFKWPSSADNQRFIW